MVHGDKSLKSQMRMAGKGEFSHVLIVGKGDIILKNMGTGLEEAVTAQDVMSKLVDDEYVGWGYNFTMGEYA